MISQKSIQNLINKSLNEQRKSQRLFQKDFECNNHSKVMYRFLCNMLSGWESLGFQKFPQVQQAIEIAKISNKYFGWLFQSDRRLDQFRFLHETVSEVWRQQNKI